MLRALRERGSVSMVLATKIMNRAQPPKEQRIRPMNHMQIVNAGMSGSSMLDTDALTSGKGLSSSLIASRSNSILRGEKEKGLWWVGDRVDMEDRKGGEQRVCWVDKEGVGGCQE